jgi:hypothetical protein
MILTRALFFPIARADVAANAWTIDVLLPVVATPEEAAQPFRRAASTNDSKAEMQVGAA